MKRPKPITQFTPETLGDKIATWLFWGFVIGYPLFVAVWRWLN